jgi:hypothetical protein
MEDKKCKHPSCLCQARPGSDYCSLSCESAGDTVEITCDCGHPGCNVNT